MAVTKYTYSVSSDFPNHKVDSDRLISEIAASSVTVALDHINTSADVCDLWFKAALSSEEHTALSGVVAVHSGELLPRNTLTRVQVYSAENSPQPIAADGKPFVLPNSFPGEVLLNFAGASDKISAPVARFGGALFGLQKTGVGDESVAIDLLDGIFLAGGHIKWDGGSWGSSISMKLVAPASTTKAPAIANQGNCNKVGTGYGFNIIVPAAGDGVYDLDVPVPVPATDEETNAQNGYWNYSEPWIGKGTMSPSAAPTAKYNLYDVQLTLAHFTKLHLFLDAGQRDMVAPAIKPKWILPEWKMTVILSNVDAGKTLRAGWDLLIARRKSA